MMSRKTYVQTAEILNYLSDKVHPAIFSKVIGDFAVMFAKDNSNFDINKFHDASGYKTINLN